MKDASEGYYLVVTSPKYRQTDGGTDSLVFRGSLDELTYKFGTKSSNPMKSFVSKGKHFLFRFFQWSGKEWREIVDPRPE